MTYSTEEREEIENVRFYDKLDENCSSTIRYDKVLVVGDYSAKVRKGEDQRQVAGQYSLHNKNSNKWSVVFEFAIRNNLFIKRIWFLHKRIHLGTWRVPTNQPNWPYFDVTKIFFVNPRCQKPVSYTHLDVYKRQSLLCATVLPQVYYVFDIGSMNVNKRQTIMCLTLAVWTYTKMKKL